MKKLIILGREGRGERVYEYIKEQGEYDVIGFLNDFKPVGESIFDESYRDIKVLGKVNDILDFFKKDDDIYVLNIIATGYKTPRSFLKRLKSLDIPDERFITYIHPDSRISPSVACIGKSVLISEYVGIDSKVYISDFCCLNPHSYVAYNTKIGEFTQVSNNAIVSANCNIGKCVHIGLGAQILENVTVGDYATIGMGAVVLYDVPPLCSVIGNPAEVFWRKDIDKL